MLDAGYVHGLLKGLRGDKRTSAALSEEVEEGKKEKGRNGCNWR